jgi:hypothetical protein
MDSNENISAEIRSNYRFVNQQITITMEATNAVIQNIAEQYAVYNLLTQQENWKYRNWLFYIFLYVASLIFWHELCTFWVPK